VSTSAAKNQLGHVFRLATDFEAMYASMQTPRSQRKVDALLAASADRLNKAAARSIRKTRG
jgi:hypothetical protein